MNFYFRKYCIEPDLGFILMPDLKGKNIEIARKGDVLLREESIVSADLQSIEIGVHRKFAACEYGNDEQMLGFVSEYGFLGRSFEYLHQEKSAETEYYAETLKECWNKYRFVHDFVDLLNQVYVDYNPGIDSVLESLPMDLYLQNQFASTNDKFNMKSSIICDSLNPSETHSDFANKLMDFIVQLLTALRENCSLFFDFDCNVSILANNAFGHLTLSLMHELSGKSEFCRCAYETCTNIFELTKISKQGSKKYCSNECNLKAYRLRKKAQSTGKPAKRKKTSRKRKTK